MDMEYCENHQQEFEDMAVAEQEVEEMLCASSNEPLSLEEQNWGIVYSVRDNISTFTGEQLAALTEYTTTATTPKQRLRAEAVALYNNIDKLAAFLRRRNIDGVLLTKELKLTNAQVFLMQEQLELEKKLYNILASRLSIFDAKVKDEEEDTIEVAEDGN